MTWPASLSGGASTANGNPYFKRGTLFRDALSILRTAERAHERAGADLGMLAAKGVKGASVARIRSLANGLAHSMRNNTARAVERVALDSRARGCTNAHGQPSLQKCVALTQR
jgi:hypothetical protein